MAAIKETKTVTITQTSIVDEVCDKCGKSLYDEVDHYEKFESTFEIESGKVYPEGGDIKVLTMQMCKECTILASKILREHGFKFVESSQCY